MYSGFKLFLSIHRTHLKYLLSLQVVQALVQLEALEVLALALEWEQVLVMAPVVLALGQVVLVMAPVVLALALEVLVTVLVVLALAQEVLVMVLVVLALAQEVLVTALVAQAQALVGQDMGQVQLGSGQVEPVLD